MEDRKKSGVASRIKKEVVPFIETEAIHRLAHLLTDKEKTQLVCELISSLYVQQVDKGGNRRAEAKKSIAALLIELSSLTERVSDDALE